MLALAEYELLTCAGCSGWLPETTAKENDEAYDWPQPIRCHSCTSSQQAQEVHTKDAPQPYAVRWTRPVLKRR